MAAADSLTRSLAGADTLARPLTAAELGQLIDALLKPTALIEGAIVLGCLLLAWLVTLGLRGRRLPQQSTLFGDRLIDGALFPALALLFALVARWVLLGNFRDEVPLAVFRIVIPILLSLAVIRLTVRVLRVTFPKSDFMRVVERSLSWVAWIAVVLWVIGLLPLMMAELDTISWKLGATRISVRNIVEGSISALLVLMLALWLSSMLEARLMKGAVSDNLSVRKMAANALRAVLLLVGLMMALSAAGIDLTALGVLGGALGVGIGLGMQKLAANYVSGFVILAERSMRIGDMVRVDNFEGRISDITTRYTVIRSLGGRESIVPNEMMITQRVENLSLADPRVSVNTVVQVAYGTDLQALMPTLLAAVKDVPRVLSDPGPAVQLSAFAADGLELTVGFWIGDSHNGTGNVKSDVNLALLKALNTAGVDIPFPQRVLHRAPAARATSGPGASP